MKAFSYRKSSHLSSPGGPSRVPTPHPPPPPGESIPPQNNQNFGGGSQNGCYLAGKLNQTLAPNSQISPTDESLSCTNLL